MISSLRRAWLFPNHSPESTFTGYNNIHANDVIIAIDKGLEFVLSKNINPNIIIGDFDSLADSKLLLDFSPQMVLRYPTAKNETDTELAILWCIQNQIEEIIICNDMAGRMDHALALIQNLLLAKQHGISARIEGNRQIAFFLQEQEVLAYPVGTLLSLIAYSDKASIQSSEGLSFPLNSLKLYQWQSRGISNVLNLSPACIQGVSGKVFCLLTIF